MRSRLKETLPGLRGKAGTDLARIQKLLKPSSARRT